MDEQHTYAIVPLPDAPAPRPEDVASPESVVAALYDVISGPAEKEEERDWDRFRSLMAPGARFLLVRWVSPDGVDEVLREWDAEQFIKAGKAFWHETGFWEREIWRRTDRFGNVAHVLSTAARRRAFGDRRPVHTDRRLQMEPQLERYAAAVTRMSGEVAALDEALSEAQFAWRPAEDRWSIGQHLVHLAKTTEEYLKAMEDAMEDARAKGLVEPGPYRGGLLGRLFLWSMAPPVRLRIRTFRILEPPERPTKADAVAEFLRSQEELGHSLKRADGIDLGRATLRSPFLRSLKLSLGQAFEAIIVHNARHLWHIEQLRQDPRFPVPGQAEIGS